MRQRKKRERWGFWGRMTSRRREYRYSCTYAEWVTRDLGIHALLVHALHKQAKDRYSGLDFRFEGLTIDPMHLCLSRIKNAV